MSVESPEVVVLPEAEVLPKTPEQIAAEKLAAEKLAAERIETLKKLATEILRILRDGVRPRNVYYTDMPDTKKYNITDFKKKRFEIYVVLNTLIGERDSKLYEAEMYEELYGPKTYDEFKRQKALKPSVQLAKEIIQTLNGLDLEALRVLRDGARPPNVYYSDRHNIPGLNDKKRKMYVVLNTLIGEIDPELAEPKREKKVVKAGLKK